MGDDQGYLQLINNHGKLKVNHNYVCTIVALARGNGFPNKILETKSFYLSVQS
jgi:hypothetical protein